MGLSRAFGCFSDPEARAVKRQKKGGKRTHNEKTQPNRVVAAAGRGGQAGTEARKLSDRSSLPATTTMREYGPSPSVLGDDESEPWSVGAVIRRTSLLQARLAEAANERNQTKKEDAKMATLQTKPGVLTEEKEGKATSMNEITSALNMKGIEDRGGGSGVRATMMFGVPTTKKEPEVDLRAIEEEAEDRKRMEENNALAAKGSSKGKYGGARNWSDAYNQKAAPVSLHERNTKMSGWGLSGLSGSFTAAMDEPYYDYETGAPSASASNPYSSPYGYGGKRKSHYAYVSGPAN